MDKIDAQTVERWEAWLEGYALGWRAARQMTRRPYAGWGIEVDPPYEHSEAWLEGFREAFVKELER